MAGGAGALPAAIRVDTRDVVLDRGLHHGFTDRDVDRVGGPVVFDERNLRHERSLSWLIGGYRQNSLRHAMSEATGFHPEPDQEALPPGPPPRAVALGTIHFG